MKFIGVKFVLLAFIEVYHAHLIFNIKIKKFNA